MKDNKVEKKNEAGVYQTLLLIPDISGFTQYMNASSIAHSQVNIARLLESIIDSNILNLSVSEIEGDAILFYKFNDESSFVDVMEQIRRMYVSFHKTLKHINVNNTCECGACGLLYNLSLKFIVHFGEVGSVMVKDYCKLFGGDIIIAHRLLKNSITSDEYVLFTNSFIKRYLKNKTMLNNDWIKTEQSSDTYDVLGNIEYFYGNLNELKNTIAVNK